MKSPSDNLSKWVVLSIFIGGIFTFVLAAFFIATA